VKEKVSIDEMAETIMKGLTEYCDLATDRMKDDVKKAAKTVKKEIQEKAPVRNDGRGTPGAYKKSWRTKVTSENSNTIAVTVYSAKQYMLTHLLEKGHANRGGGRTKAIPHIAPAQEVGEKKLEKMIQEDLKQ